MLSAAVPREVQHWNSCITENLGAVSPLFLSLCQKPFMIQNLIYRCSLDKLAVYIVQESDMKEPNKNTAVCFHLRCALTFGSYQFDLSLSKYRVQDFTCPVAL